MSTIENNEVKALIDNFSSGLNYDVKETSIILAAGHGKRIKSHTSKMLHKIWGTPTVERVYDSCRKGLKDANSIIVVGIKASDVIKVIGSRKNTVFAYQEVQNGTGHAVQVALESFKKDYSGIVYVLPGDMGLIDPETMALFSNSFKQSGKDMMVLTGIYEGNPLENSYGRILRVKEFDVDGTPSNDDFGNVIEIMEYKDILKLEENTPYVTEFRGRKYSYSRQELIENNEFNSGVFAFDYVKLIEQVKNLDSNNAQNEIYITDLIALFNNNNYSVGAVSPNEQHVIMGFNNKAVLKEMDAIARKLNYDKIKNIIAVQDEDDFYIEDDVIENIIEMDKNGIPLDIVIGKGAYVGRGVKLNYNVELGKNVFVEGNVHFGKNVKVSQNVHLSTYSNQQMNIEDDVTILWGDIIKGNITIGKGSEIQSSVNITGSDEYPVRIGKNVIIKGTSYVFGSVIDDDIFIEHSVLIKKRVEKLIKKNGEIQQIRFLIPQPEGMDAVEDLN